MNTDDRTARRYHWLSDNMRSYVEEPHEAVVCDVKKARVLNMVAEESEECRRASVDLVNEGPDRLKRILFSFQTSQQQRLERWIGHKNKEPKRVIDTLIMPRRINWNAVKAAYEIQPKNYEELLGLKGVGPSLIRGLALVSEIVYGPKPSWRDPVKYSFCVGGKDGVPYPVDRSNYDQIIEILSDAVTRAKINKRERLKSLRRLSYYLKKVNESMGMGNQDKTHTGPRKSWSEGNNYL
jgi:hypothetical protein